VHTTVKDSDKKACNHHYTNNRNIFKYVLDSQFMNL